MLIGESAIKHHDLPAAEHAFRTSAEHAPGAVDPRRRLVYLLTLGQRQDEARTLLWDLYRLTGDPRHLATVVGLATTDGDTRDLARELEVYVKQTPGDPWVARAWGLMLMRVGRAAEARGWPVVLQVHDEIVCETPIGQVTADALAAVMNVLPAWARGCPITSKTFIRNRYGKE